MYQPQLIQDAFMGLVGFRQTESPDFPQLSSALLKTSSNLLIDHALLNIENIDMTARNYAALQYPAYNNATTYATGQRIRAANGKVYDSLQDANVGHEPSASPTWWSEVNLLSLHLEDVVRSSIDQVVEAVFDEKKLRKETKTVLESVRAMDTVGNMNDLIVKTGRLVGLEVRLQHNQNIAAYIEQIGIQLSQEQTLTLHVFHSSQADEIASVEINFTKPGSFQWIAPAEPLVLHHLTDSYAPGGVFWILYDEDDLTGQAIDARYDFTIAPCSCNPYAYKNWFRMTKFVNVRAVYMNAEDRDGDVSTLPDARKMKYDHGTNFGLNFDISAKCDLTQFLIRQKQLFAPAIRDQVIVRLLEQMRNSTRQNMIDEKTKSLANFALQSRTVGGGGLLDQLSKKIKTVDIEVSALDGVCMPCANKPGVKHSTFGLQW